MNVLPTTAGSGVAEQAETLADMACELHDVAITSASWSAAAVEFERRPAPMRDAGRPGLTGH